MFLYVYKTAISIKYECSVSVHNSVITRKYMHPITYKKMKLKLAVTIISN